MPQLLAIGPQPSERWQNSIPSDEMFRLGRAIGNEWEVYWDSQISREHAELKWKNDELNVRCLESARNPIVFHGRSYNQITLSVGQEFNIGDTLFRVIHDDDDSISPGFFLEGTVSAGPATRYALRIADYRVELVSTCSRKLWLSRSERDLAKNLVNVFQEVIPHADTVAVIQTNGPKNASKAKMKVLHWSGRSTHDAPLPVNRAMVKAAIEKSETVLEIWDDADSSKVPVPAGDGGRWAFSTPIKVESRSGLCIYISGLYGDDFDLPRTLTVEDLKGDVSFVELLAQIASAIQQVRIVEDKFAGIRQFFSPAVMESLSGADAETALAPVENDTVVLFCDLRGFSQQVEQSQSDLKILLARVSEALGVMTENIIDHDGVIADFQGDAALGFWGWPIPLTAGPLPACKAALQIWRTFGLARSAKPPKSDLADFQVGIGIASGRAIAGKIGSKDQAKVGVFGPVVNLGARLEGMTKQIGVPILMDELSANAVRQNLPATEGRCRRIGLIRPHGVSTAMWVSELLPPEGKIPAISNQNIADFEGALNAFVEGNWDKSLELLGRMPAKDRAKDFLLLFIASNDYEPPTDWDGIIPLSSK